MPKLFEEIYTIRLQSHNFQNLLSAREKFDKLRDRLKENMKDLDELNYVNISIVSRPATNAEKELVMNLGNEGSA